ncbi:inositol hexakisphosphate kinase 1 [Achaetomium macrosporum]|uniref:Kinase n=1 Tax=Achaetomium macrosporum TaxID=79813 RepID=A0AAN7CBN0_9PEZI|nr:inositol hexakisphosphate kinase 1 [Achaetomium macrosporum]
MSNLPSSPENAAAAAAVSPARTAGDAAKSLPGAEAPPPCPPVVPTQETEPLSSVPPLPPSTPPAQQGTPGTDPLVQQATVISAASHADPVKYARGPAVLQRHHGPSLLTQALATARGIPRQHQPNNSPYPPQHSSELQESLSADAEARDSRHGSLTQADGNSLPPRVSPRKTIMPSATATSTTVASPLYGRIDLSEVNSVLNGHREFLTKTKGRTGSFEGSERERPGRWHTYSHDKAATNPLASPRFTDSPPPLQDEIAGDNGGSDPRPQPRAWKTEHRVSMGPEKAWSIGAGDSANSQDGQVEKSISEVLAGVEHNTRSRKASHSLRFFKEGLPEEKGRRKDQRSAQTPRDKSPPRGERLADIKEQTMDAEAVEPQVLEDAGLLHQQQNGPQVPPTRSPEVKSTHGSPEDHFAQRHSEDVRDVAAEPVLSEHKGDGDRLQDVESTEPGHLLKPGGECDLSNGAGESAEEGEESGEEKISSAVFLPHQAPEQEQGHSPVPGVPQRVAPSRRHSRHDDFHPWLVKADEPEPDDKEGNVDLESKVRPEAAEYASIAPKVASRQVDESAPVDEREPGVPSSRPSRPVSQYYEDAVHEHQLTPKQPLEAIELIPYKHQVGGHTTLWRFSRRAVCKQLNNRENEFYEKVEKYHRDLLAFLPRYIGVLNVTFQKQPRRKSTMRRDETAPSERSQAAPNEPARVEGNGTTQGEAAPALESQASGARVISQSMQSSTTQIPTVTFADNQHILPRNLLQPTANLSSFPGRFRSASAYAQGTGGKDVRATGNREEASRPGLQDRPNSWGATTVNKKLRNEVFNDAFLKQPIAIHRHRKGHQRVPRRTLQQVLRPSGSDPSLIESHEKKAQTAVSAGEGSTKLIGSSHMHSQSDLGRRLEYCEDQEAALKDVTGTSAPEPEILGESSPAQKKKRRYSGTGLRRKPKDVREGRGDLKYFAEADDAGYKGDREDSQPVETFRASPERTAPEPETKPFEVPATAPAPPVGPLGYSKIPRPVNPKEAQTQRDSRVEYFLLLEDLTAGMKRPCIMDLKMGTRQYGVDANPKKQKSQQGKCAKTTSRELGVRVCGLQVWDVKTQRYEFKDKYYGRELKKGAEFQAALTRFLYDGVDRASILRHIPTVLQKLDELEVIIKRLRGYRFYAASLLMFYDGDDTADNNNNNNNNYYVEDSTTDFATDTEEAPNRRARRSRREIDFKMADFANCVTAGDLSARDRPCPPKHPDEPDRGFLRGLRSLRRYFLKIQRDTRAEMGLVAPLRQGDSSELLELDETEDEGSVSE